MANKNDRALNDHPSHPFRNFLYLLYSLLNTAAFCLTFLFYAWGELVYAAAMAGVVLIAFVLGIIRAMSIRKK